MKANRIEPSRPRGPIIVAAVVVVCAVAVAVALGFGRLRDIYLEQ